MATAPTPPIVSVDEYLNTTYEYDMEFVDGVLVERALPTYAHGLFQLSLGEHLRRYRFQFHFAVSSECRVELVERSRYRVPDLLIAALPGPEGKVLKSVPLAVIEILSPDDRLSQQVQRFAEYWRRGVREIVVLDPDEFIGYRFIERGLLVENIDTLHLPGGIEVPFPTVELFEDLRRELSRKE